MPNNNLDQFRPPPTPDMVGLDTEQEQEQPIEQPVNEQPSNRMPSSAELIQMLAEKSRQSRGGLQSGIQEGLEAFKSIVKPGDMSDLFEVPQPEDNDINTDDLLDLSTEDVFGGPEDMSDLFRVTKDDIIGKPLTSRKARKLLKRTNKPYLPGGMQGMR